MRAQVGGLTTGNVSGNDKYNLIAWGVVQSVVDYYTYCHRGFDLDDKAFNVRLARYHLLPEDLSDLTADGAWWLGTELTHLLGKTTLDHPFLFRVLSNGDLLIGIDERDLPCSQK